ncbi:unnamed protein product [Heligmosomoides polygyrus]|uniref:Lasso peptide n=1 Tax=Heligmosomoides polygyrus TaxID=6339 RepID=A0A183GSR9_HELPZ|nr:unnamed protein product [Heligmosomoides polygyrus]
MRHHLNTFEALRLESTVTKEQVPEPLEVFGGGMLKPSCGAELGGAVEGVAADGAGALFRFDVTVTSGRALLDPVLGSEPFD